MALRARDAFTRERDEMLLEWVRLRGVGYTASEIAAKYGTTPIKVKQNTLDVRREDIACEGLAAAKAYWDSGAMRAMGRKGAQNKIARNGLKTRKAT